MTWPTADVSTTSLDAGSDSAATARASLLDLAQKFNQMRAHVSAFMQGLLGSASAGTACTALGLGNHGLLTVDASGNLTAPGNVTAYSDERLKEAWEEIPPDFVHFLAHVRAGTYQRKAGDGQRYAGVSAQSLQELLPEAVQRDQHGMLSVAYGNAALLACVALAREVQALRAEVRQLRGSS